MNITQLKGFISIAQTRNITQSAKRAHMTQQAMSKNIAKLEEELGVDLFVRGERQMVLTNVGVKLLPVAESLVQKYDEHVRLMNNIIETSSRTVTIAFENQLLLNIFPSDMLSHMGDMFIKGYIGSDNAGCVSDVSSKRADCAFLAKPPELKGLSYYEVINSRPCVIMSRQHPLAGRKELYIRDLKNENHSWLTINAQNYHEYYAACLKEGFFPKMTSEFPSAEQQSRYLGSSMEVVVGVEDFFVLDNPALVRIPLITDDYRIRIGFLYRPEDKDHSYLQSYFKSVKVSFEK